MIASTSLATPDGFHIFCAFLAALIAGAVNSVAGGGTMISFPALLALGLPPIMANATNTVGIWPGSVGSLWGFRRELARIPRAMRWLLVPALFGGAAGAMLLRLTPASVFDRLVPWLVLFSTVLFILQVPIQKKLRSAEAAQKAGPGWMAVAIFAQVVVAVYGGYFGAGMSIMMLSILGILGLTDILEMSAMTSLLALCINGVAGVLFAQAGLVFWPYVVAMMAGAVAGGYGAANVARRIGRTFVRRFVIIAGLTIAVAMFVSVARNG
jgi:uncharacterized membrane protein YfcA